MIVPKMTEFDYVLKEERELPESEQTVFRLRPLTYREHEDIERGSKVAFERKTDRAEVLAETKAVARRVLNLGLVGWRNLRDEEGHEVEFRRLEKKGSFSLPEEALDILSGVANELSNAITERSALTKEASKNS